MICPNCNTMNPNSIKKCIKCGEKLEKSSGGPALKPSASTGGPMLKQKSKPEKPAKVPKQPGQEGGNKGNLRLLLLLLLLVVAAYFGWTYYGDELLNLAGGKQQDSLLTADTLEVPQDSTVLLYSELKKTRQDTTLYKTLSDAEKAQLSKKRKTYTDKFYYSKDNKKMILIQGHSFKMGSESGTEIEKPQHTAKVIDFYLDETEVTNAQFKKFLEETKYKPKGSLSHLRDRRFNADDMPVVDVDYDDAVAYCAWAGKRLPTEIEWECAAKDTQNLVYPTGKDMTPKDARFGLNITTGTPMPVKSYKPNSHGIYDLAGNVSEWVHGVIYAYPGNESFSRYFGKTRVPRGGSWMSLKEDCKTYRRAILDISQSTGNIGFRGAISKSEIENLINK